VVDIKNWKDILELTVLIFTVIGALFGFYNAIHNISRERKRENVLIIKTLFALTKGMEQLGANGPVTEARKNLENFVIEN
jgi:hypothetical protein